MTVTSDLSTLPESWVPTELRHLLGLNPSVPAARRGSQDEVSFLPMELIGEDGSLHLSRVRPVLDVLTECSCIQQINAIVEARNTKFLFYAITAAYDRIWAASIRNTLPPISAGRLGQVKLPAPQPQEQGEIVAYFDAVREKIDALLSKAHPVIEKLRQYRSALITDAFTGKIDVQGVA